MTMAKRTARSKASQAPTDDTADRRNTPSESADDRTPVRNASSDSGAAVMDLPTQAGAPPADDATRADSMSSEPPELSPSRAQSDEDIRARAYQRYLERGGSHGQDFEDWIEAEQELRNRK